MKREIKKTIRFNLDEFSKVEEHLKNECMNFSDFARSKILNHEFKKLSEIENIHKSDAEKIKAINSYGNNLNQIAKQLNEMNLKKQVPNFEKLLKILIDIETRLENL
jgi:hypothetical protein